jgi:hypothetical protein
VCLLQLERVLGSEQRRSDFMPRDDALRFDQPTSACLLGTALLSALGAAAKDTLEGNNLRAFLAEVRMIVLDWCRSLLLFGARVGQQCLMLKDLKSCMSKGGVDCQCYSPVTAMYSTSTVNCIGVVLDGSCGVCRLHGAATSCC